MLIRICIKYYKLVILFLVPISIQAEEVNYISNDINTQIVSTIDKFFIEQPQTKTELISHKSEFTTNSSHEKSSKKGKIIGLLFFLLRSLLVFKIGLLTNEEKTSCP